jgi:transcriptional regulator with XRE-family HTH domain
MNLSDYLKSEIARRSLSVRKAADHIGISHVTLLRILSNETPNLETLHKLSAWTHADLAFLLQLLGYKVETKNVEMDRLARLVEFDPSYRRLLDLIEKLGPEELEYAVDYLEYLTWRLGSGSPAGERVRPQPEAARAKQPGEADESGDVDQQDRSPADMPMRSEG